MFVSAIIASLLIGITLGQRFKVLILIPLFLLTLLFAFCIGITHSQSAWVVAKVAALIIIDAQIGYIFGIGIRHLTVLARANRSRMASVSSTLPRRRAAQ